MGLIKIKSIATSDKGNYRKINQDKFLLNGANDVNKYSDYSQCRLKTRNQFQLYAVWDGMGGASCGGQASLIGAQIAERYRGNLLKKNIESPQRYLMEYLEETNEEICHMIETKGIKASGTTAAIVCFYKDKFYCANIGDTKIYLFRNDEIQQLSVDHTEQATFQKMNLHINSKQEMKHILTQYLGIKKEEMLIEPYYFNIQPKHKDILLICSDGLNEKVDDAMIKEILINHKDIEKAQYALMEQALKLKSKDNITIMLLEFLRGF